VMLLSGTLSSRARPPSRARSATDAGLPHPAAPSGAQFELLPMRARGRRPSIRSSRRATAA
jgi:hypothetical protein